MSKELKCTRTLDITPDEILFGLWVGNITWFIVNRPVPQLKVGK